MRRTLGRLQRSLAAFDRTVRWVRPEQMHLTLKFLGEVPDGQVPDITDAVALAAEQSQGFILRTDGAGCFPPGRSKVRVVWVGLEADPALLACQANVEAALAEAGFPPEARAFSPHLTLGRVKNDATAGKLRAAVEAIPIPVMEQEVDSIVLMQSELRREGARYLPVGSWPLV